MKWKNLKRFQGSTFDTIARRILVEDQIMIREIFKMLNQYAVDILTLPVNLCLFHLIQFLEECQAVLWECRAAERGRQDFGHTVVYRDTFL